jgi:hypothetical protein
MTKYMTVFELAAEMDPSVVDHDGVVNSQLMAEHGFAMFGGCYLCAATIAFYNAYPTKQGSWVCKDCLAHDVGFESVSEFLAFECKEKFTLGSRKAVFEEYMRVFPEADVDLLCDLALDFKKHTDSVKFHGMEVVDLHPESRSFIVLGDDDQPYLIGKIKGYKHWLPQGLD